MNIKIVISGIISIVCIVLIIISAIKYSNPSYSSCNIVFDGYIKILNIVYGEQKITGIVIAGIDIYKIDELKFIEYYEMLTSLDDYTTLKTHYDNATIIKLFKKCIGVADKKYYLKDFIYHSSGNWQLIIAYSCLFLFVSIVSSAWFFIEIKIKKADGIIDPGQN